MRHTITNKERIQDISSVDQHTKFYIALFAALLLGLIVRIAALQDLMSTVYGDYLLIDEEVYHTWAQKIAAGTFNSTSVYEFAPLPAYIMAVVYKLISPDIFYIRILNIFFGVVSCGVIYLIGKELAGKKVGLLACLTACLYKPLIFYSIVPLKESLSFLLFSLMCYLLIKVVGADSAGGAQGGIKETGNLAAVGLLGTAAGLVLNVRPNAIVLIPLIPFLILWAGYRDRVSFEHLLKGAILYVIGFSVAVAPFVARNYAVAGKVALTTSQAGFNLYLGNNLQNPDPYYRPVPFANSSPFEQGIQFTIEASRRSGKKMTPLEASDYWTHEVTREAATHPIPFARKMGQKVLVLVNRFEACDHYDIDFISNFATFFKVPFISFGIIFSLSVVGIFTHIKDTRARTLIVILSVYAATLVIFYTNARYRLPMLAIMIPFAALGIREFYRDLQSKRFVLFARHLTCAGVLLAIAFLPVQATDDRTAYWTAHGNILYFKGFENEAITYWKRASTMNKSASVFADVSLASWYYSKGYIQEGNTYLNKVRDDSFAAAGKYDILGDCLTRIGNAGAAIAAYEKSLSINFGQIAVRKKLIAHYNVMNPQKAAMEKGTLRYIQSFYDLM